MATLALRSPAAQPTSSGAQARSPVGVQVGLTFLLSFSAVAIGLGAARAATTSYVPVLLDEIAERPGLIGLAMLSNALAGFFVPLAVGLWADRHPSRRPLIVGGVAISAGGLVAVALGSATTYLLLTLAAAAVYVGLNVVQTAHRALVPERFDDSARPRATSAQELGQLVGALVGTVVGGVLVLAAPGLLFAVIAGIAVLSALPTLRLATVRQHTSAPAGSRPATISSLGAALRRRGTRELLVAQTLWVGAYVGLTPFFVLYAKHVLGLSTGAAGGLLAAFGLLTGAGMLWAARIRPEQVRRTLTLGVASLGAGLSLAATGSTLAVVAAPFALAAVGAGLATSLGFVYFSRFIPAGETGRYSGAFLAARALAAGVALPAAGLVVDLTGSYRALLAMGSLALVAVIPIRLAERRVASARSRSPIQSLAAIIPVLSFRPVVDTWRVARETLGPRKAAEPLPDAGALVAYTRAFGPRLLAMVMLAVTVGAALPALQALDEHLFLAINGLGDGPEWLYQALDPHSRNYALIVALVVAASLLVRGPLRYVGGAALTVVFAAFFADIVLEVVQLSVDRPRPQETIGAGVALSHDRSWSHIPSFPSGHLVVTAAMVAAAASALPKLRTPLLGYLGAVAVTRILFGAHFPLDVGVGAILGWEIGVFAAGLAAAGGLLPRPETERRTLPELGPARQPVVGGR